ncbi:gag/pol protein [Cucumis melo var. makuwa]|uniref:Gag/pol protein n=1 Tax=Cucumis melo var. makuwa TaxID=1194695 RepID=A0A5A7UAQ1_CUCMM|nr:gag/pol protein [Cucumis melo var. makuwa]TYK07752.1 gag/pol protein [Cucumis melo var. makuwa]
MLVYGAKDYILTEYTDSDFQTDKDSRKSTSGSVFTLNRGAMLWCSIKQGCIVDSTMKVEYVVACKGAKKAVWLRKYVKIYKDQCSRYNLKSLQYRDKVGYLILARRLHRLKSHRRRSQIVRERQPPRGKRHARRRSISRRLRLQPFAACRVVHLAAATSSSSLSFVFSVNEQSAAVTQVDQTTAARAVRAAFRRYRQSGIDIDMIRVIRQDRSQPNCLIVSSEYTTDQFVLGVPLGSPKASYVPSRSHVARVRKRASSWAEAEVRAKASWRATRSDHEEP